MGEDVSPELIKKTQNALSKYVKESLLNEKFLKKPPFRYLQDVIKNIIKETGFLKDVFSQDELLDYGKDKERKIAFLKKLIGAVQDATGDQIAAKPNKIIAGLEVGKTLGLLQEVGKAVSLKENGVKKPSVGKKEDLKKTRDSSVTKEPGKKPKSRQEPVKSEENLKDAKKKGNKPDSKESDTKEKRKRDKPEREAVKDVKKSEDKKKDKRRSSIESNQGEKKDKEASLSKQNSLQDENKENSSTRRASGQKLKSPKLEPAEENQKNQDDPSSVVRTKSIELSDEVLNKESSNKESLDKDKVPTSAKPKGESPKKDEGESIPKTAKERRPSSKRTSGKTKTDKVDKQDKVPSKDVEVPLLGSEAPDAIPKIERPKTARKAPPSARPGAPKARDRGEVKQDLNASSSEPEAKPVPVIIETDSKDDDKDNLVMLEAQPISMENDVQNGIIMPEAEDEHLGENEGALVAQILETKKELEESKQLWAPSANKVEIEWEGGKKQKREAIIKEVNRIKEGIQQLTRATNPLGKLFDFLQEDVDSMQRELRVWTETNANYSRQFKEEQKLTESALETYKRQLAELDGLIEQEQETVRNLKATILANDKKIINIVTRVP